MEINEPIEGSIKSENDSQYSQLVFDDALDTSTQINVSLSNCILCSNSDSELLLSCLHPVCLKCFPKIINADNTLQCKQCDISLDAISWNWRVKNISQRCKFCLSIPGYDDELFYCLRCYSLICPSCEMVHNTRFQDHSMMSLNHGFQLCCKHPDKYMEWFCKDCDHTICENCQMDADHDDHNVIWALDWVKKSLDEQTQTPLCYYKYSTLEENRLPDAIDVLDKECEMMERDVHSTRLAVSQTVKKLMNLLRDYNDQINTELDAYQKRKLRSLQSTKKQLQNTKQKSDLLVRFIKNLPQSVSVKEALFAVNFFTNHSEDIRSQFSLAEDIIQNYIELQASRDDSQMGGNSLWRESSNLQGIVKQIGVLNCQSKSPSSNENSQNLNFKRSSPYKSTPTKENSKKKRPKDCLPNIRIKIPKDSQENGTSSNNSTPPVQSSSSFDDGHSSSYSNDVNHKKKPSKRRQKSSKRRKSKFKYSKLSSPCDSCDEFIYSLYRPKLKANSDPIPKPKKNEDDPRHCLVGSPFTTESVSEPSSPDVMNLIAPDHAEDDPHEDYCSVCYDGGDLVCCSRCVHVYHCQCHLPPVEQVSLEDDWVCIMCRDLQPLNSDQNQATSDSLSTVEYMIACKCLMAMYFDKINSLPFVTLLDADEDNGRYYYSIVKRPIALSTLTNNLSNQLYYSSLGAFICDVELMFNNCYKYNGPQSSFGQKATELKNVFYETLKQYTSKES